MSRRSLDQADAVDGAGDAERLVVQRMFDQQEANAPLLDVERPARGVTAFVFWQRTPTLPQVAGRDVPEGAALRDWLARVEATPDFVPLPEPDAAAQALIDQST